MAHKNYIQHKTTLDYFGCPVISHELLRGFTKLTAQNPVRHVTSLLVHELLAASVWITTSGGFAMEQGGSDEPPIIPADKPNKIPTHQSG